MACMTTIGATIIIKGELSSDEDLVLEGQFDGQVLLRDATVTIGRTATINADVRGTRVTVLGQLKGSIAATERIELATSATVIGNLSANQVVLEEGTTFTGRIDMDRRTIAAKVAQYKAAVTT
jgi:cytoskeletal protein CcmA (bactofilin family)